MEYAEEGKYFKGYWINVFRTTSQCPSFFATVSSKAGIKGTEPDRMSLYLCSFWVESDHKMECFGLEHDFVWLDLNMADILTSIDYRRAVCDQVDIDLRYEVYKYDER